MRATQAALGRSLPAEVLAQVDSYRRARRRRAREERGRQALYLAQAWVLALRRKAALTGRQDVWLPFPLAHDFTEGEWAHRPYIQALYAWYREQYGL
jgi:hypothetical protein